MKARCTPFSVRDALPHVEPAGSMGERLDQLVGALVALAPLADAAVDDLLQVVAARKTPDLAGANPRARVPFHQHPQELPDLIHVVARLPLRAPRRSRISLGAVNGFSVPARIPRRSLWCRTIPKSPSFRYRPSQTKTFIGVRSRWSIWPRCSFPSTWRMPAISRRAAASGHRLPVRCRNARRSPCARVLEREAVQIRGRPRRTRGNCRRRGSPADARPGVARSTPRAAIRRCARSP